ncbi:DNA ligase D [Pelomonas sp. P7]|uniref:DNA ligase (ATP) n=1 Tax=Pelomonas caseinilytica TaxID=2906763 RepID=A0ABS8XI95_9BURK|nr:DNA ligase D [Pelomonas sp. P7]MCE4538662.1 DNA ligase D [Pelomonas sp. P7]
MTRARATGARGGETPLARYNAKRDFSATAEPEGRVGRKRAKALAFIVQKHWASRLHYDFRLELDGVMLSWAVPKGPSYDPAVKHMAVRVEDHPVSYNRFEGEIPKGHYGAGKVIVWDRGTWTPAGVPRQGLEAGKLVFDLHGEKLAGRWELVRTGKPGDRQERWLLLKKRDAWARPESEYDVVTALPDSVVETPLGLVEEREPHGAVPAATPAGSDLSAAVKAAFPRTLEPQLATLATGVPAEGRWIVENKFDGYRLLVRLQAGKARLITRNGNDWTDRLTALAEELGRLGVARAWLDGEIVVLDEQGVPNFNRLQDAIDGPANRDILLYLFDLPFLGDRDLRRVPLESRRAALRELLQGHGGERVRFSEDLPAPPSQVLQAACRLGLEGVMLKRADSPYVGRRTDTWLKLKCQRRQEFVVVGFTDRTNAPQEVGALLLGYHDEGGRLRHAGAVGTGWSNAQGRELHERLVALEVPKPPVHAEAPPPSRRGGPARGRERWVRPEVVVEVAFGEWTPDGHIRHASFRGLRADKPARAIVREEGVPAAALPKAPKVGKAGKGAAAPAIKVSHPERVIDASTGLTKLDLVRYYESVAERMLPHLRRRPVAFVRAPQGIAGQLFFQKHAEAKFRGLTELDASLWPGHAPLLAVDTAEALVAAAQMNVVELHTWNSTARSIDKPDRVVFDLDPGEGVPWAQLQEAALLTRTMLEELGLRSWLKTSGGKGLHVVVPLAARATDERVKAFAHAVTDHMARTIPQRFVAKSGAANRVGRIFIDYLRNGHGQTTAAAFSARARPGLGVSMPVAWEQLGELKGGAQWTVQTARDHLSFESADPWADYWTTRQALPRWPGKG